MTRRALLIADCGIGVGLGHLERALALADALRPGFDASIVLPEGDASLRLRVAERGHIPVEAVGSSVDRAEAAVGGASSMEMVVLDGYVFDPDLQRKLRDRALLTVVDDLCLPTDCDLAVNPSPAGEDMRPSGAGAFLGGAAYALMRASFQEARETVLRRGSAPRTVLVSTGATDLAGIGEQLAAQLIRADGTVEVIRVVGPDASTAGLDDGGRVRVLVAPGSLAEALASATIYAGAAGTTAVQAACVGIPAVITAAVPNQLAQAAALERAGCAVVADSRDLASVCVELLDDDARRHRMAACGRSLVDGRGAVRVADAIFALTRTRVAG
jgi:spore coat polysaccharide biosynthesis predicted glycosyltransferase SpsG